MIRIGEVRMVRTLVSTLAVVSALVISGCTGEVDVTATVPTVTFYDLLPEAFIATAVPVYFEGHATYWYGGHWYYRGAGGRWAHYDREPPELHQRRVAAPPARHAYEPVRARRVEHGRRW